MNLKPATGPMAPDLDVGNLVGHVSSTERVRVARHERGWVIETTPTDTEHRVQLSEFRAEIGDCSRCRQRNQTGADLPTSRRADPRPVCTTLHTWGVDQNTKHFRTYCHELGHPERVRILADKIQKTYR